MTYVQLSPALIAQASWIALYDPSDASAPSRPDISPSSETVAVSFAFSPTVAPSILAMSAYVSLSLLAYALSFHVVSEAVSNVNTASSLLHTVFSVMAGAAFPDTLPVAELEPFPDSLPESPLPGFCPSSPPGFCPSSPSPPASSLCISTSDTDIVPVYAELELYWNTISDTAPISSTSNANVTSALPSAKLSVFRNG